MVRSRFPRGFFLQPGNITPPIAVGGCLLVAADRGERVPNPGNTDPHLFQMQCRRGYAFGRGCFTIQSGTPSRRGQSSPCSSARKGRLSSQSESGGNAGGMARGVEGGVVQAHSGAALLVRQAYPELGLAATAGQRPGQYLDGIHADASPLMSPQ
jgi:hypothetical protein